MRKFCFSLIIISVLALVFVLPWPRVLAQAANDISSQLQDKKQRIDEINKQIEQYQAQIKQKQSEGLSLKNELNILSSQINKTQLEISAKQEQISQAELEIQELQLQIAKKNLDIVNKKTELAGFLRLIYRYDQQEYWQILLTNNSFSDFFDQLKYTQNIEKKVQGDLLALVELKKNLESQQNELQDKKVGLQEINNKLVQNKDSLEDKKSAKNSLMVKTKSSEKQFQALVTQLKKEQAQINAEIVSLEKKARQGLTQKQNQQIKSLGNVSLQWPVPSHIVTTYFHDPDYPFRYVYEHPAIDIRAAQGTPIAAAESGYVGTAKNAGMGYSYIMLIHNNQISTVYGHVSKIYVSEDEFVTKGQVIGLSGGAPGTPGAGNMTTAPHLHFEVRLNGIPINPLDYLP